MKVEVHTMCWNEEEILPFFLKHYRTIADKIVIHDNHSTDHSRDIAEKAGCDVWLFGNNTLNDSIHQEIKNTAWKGSDADWVIVVDTDEFLKVDYKTLDDARYAMKDMFKVQGYNMYSDTMPRDSMWELNMGVPSPETEPGTMSKQVIFNPRTIEDINYSPGAHRCTPRAKGLEIHWADEVLGLYHYHAIGGLARFLQRRSTRASRLSPINRKMGHGVQYTLPPERQVALFQEGLKTSKPLF